VTRVCQELVHCDGGLKASPGTAQPAGSAGLRRASRGAVAAGRAEHLAGGTQQQMVSMPPLLSPRRRSSSLDGSCLCI